VFDDGLGRSHGDTYNKKRNIGRIKKNIVVIKRVITTVR
jgi:hypothetical protein